MNVFILVGPSASGKSTILRDLNYPITKLQENYMELNLFQLDNTLILSKWFYAGTWFNRILENFKAKIPHLLVDRCPLETAAYAKFGSTLIEPFLITFKELKELGINSTFIYIKSDFDILWKRTNLRIKEQPGRVLYNELNLDHNRQAYSFYENNHKLWDHVIENNADLESAIQELKVFLDFKLDQ